MKKIAHFPLKNKDTYSIIYLLYKLYKNTIVFLYNLLIYNLGKNQYNIHDFGAGPYFP